MNYRVRRDLLVACIGFAALAASPVAFGGDGRNLSSVNGSVSASPGETYNRLSTVNGDVHLGRGASADEAKTVNGEIVLDGDSKVGDASTVNGSVRDRRRRRCRPHRDDGERQRERSRIARRLAATSPRSPATSNSAAPKSRAGSKRATAISILPTARTCAAAFMCQEERQQLGLGQRPSREVRICATCVVDGELRFDRPVELRVETGAKIGQVIGSEVTRR